MPVSRIRRAIGCMRRSIRLVALYRDEAADLFVGQHVHTFFGVFSFGMRIAVVM